MAVSNGAIDQLLKPCDYLSAIVDSLQAGEPIDDSVAIPLAAAFESMLSGADESFSERSI